MSTGGGEDTANLKALNSMLAYAGEHCLFHPEYTSKPAPRALAAMQKGDKMEFYFFFTYNRPKPSVRVPRSLGFAFS